MRGLLLVAVGAVGGCSFQAGFDGDRFRCDEERSCPAGLDCVGGFCQVAHDGGVGGDDGGGAAAACGTVSLLSDDFEDGQAAPRFSRWDDPGTTVSEEGGQIRIAYAATGTEVWGGYMSTQRFRIRGGELRVEVDQVGGRYTLIELRAFAGPKAQIVVEDETTLRATILGAPGGTVEVDEVYRADQHRFWRMRGEGEELHFETSSDQTTWSQLAVLPTPFEADDVWVTMSGAGVAGDPEARFGSVNLGIASPGSYCPVAELVDGFDAPPFEPIWSTWVHDGCTIAESGSAFEVAFAAGDMMWCGLDSAHRYSLRDSAIELELAPPVGDLSPAAVIGVWLYPPEDDGTWMHLSRASSLLTFRQAAAGVESGETAPYTEADRHVRLRAAGGMIVGESSADRAEWRPLFEADERFDLSELRVVLQGGVGGGGDAEGQVVGIRGINAP